MQGLLLCMGKSFPGSNLMYTFILFKDTFQSLLGFLAKIKHTDSFNDPQAHLQFSVFHIQYGRDWSPYTAAKLGGHAVMLHDGCGMDLLA